MNRATRLFCGRSFVSPWIVFTASAILGMMLMSIVSPLRADDQFVGALWKFKMTSIKRGKEDRGGVFRVNGKFLYQKEKPNSATLDKQVGYKDSGKKGKTRLVFEDLRSNRGKYSGMTGRVVITIDRFGEWSGRMIDGEGTHWNFKCSRVQE